MDFSTINTEVDAARGADLHLLHPQLRHPLFTGEGADELGRVKDKSLPHEKVILTLRGMESEHVQEAVKKSKKKALKNPGSDEAGYDLVVSLVIAISGVKDGDRVITTSREDLEWFFRRSDDFVTQVMEFSRVPENFFHGDAPT